MKLLQRQIIYYVFALLLTGTFFSCQETIISEKGQIAIIPQPTQIDVGEGVFNLNKNVNITIPDGDEWRITADYLINQIKTSTQEVLKITEDKENASIIFKQDNSISKEGYHLNITTDNIEISAKTAQGAFYAVQSLLQLMPTSVFSEDGKTVLNFDIPAATIKDTPRFSYRGMHLDVGRHFYSPDEVKRFIDLMAIHKYNTFHWHLTEDQGWRIEIKQYPKLTEVGGFRKETIIGHNNEKPQRFDGKRYGGFYTQEEVKDIVAYAKSRFITVVPEIELPGHAQAAIAAYPELGCSDEPLEVMTKWGVSENVYCPTEETFTFLENVLKEVMPLFPGEYFHIGGDECPKKQWEESAFCQAMIKKEGLKNEFELQSYFIKRIEKILNENGKRLIGWDEILEGGLAPNATVMSWRGIHGGIEAANEGHDVIMTPTSNCYFDYYQSQHSDEPLAIGGYLPLEKVYRYEPVPEELATDKQHHIIGAQANLWTEYIPNMAQLEYMAYPRGAAMAEVVWSAKKNKNFNDFSERLKTHFERLMAMKVNAALSFFDADGKVVSENGVVKVALASNNADAVLTYTTDGSAPTANSTVYTAPFEITATGEITAASFLNGEQKGRAWKAFINKHKAVGKPITLAELPATKYGSGGKDIILNGIYGSDGQFGDKEWLGYEGKNFEAIIDLETETALKEITCRFFKSNGSWIYLPQKVSVFGSNDGENYELIGETTDITATEKVAAPIVEVNTTTRYLKIVVDRHGVIGKDMPGEGYEAWLFLGEISVM